MKPIECSLHSDCPSEFLSCLHGYCTAMAVGSLCRNSSNRNSCLLDNRLLSSYDLTCYTSQGRCRESSTYDVNVTYHYNASVPVDSEYECPVGHRLLNHSCVPLYGTGWACKSSRECLENHICHDDVCLQTCFEASECQPVYPALPFYAADQRAWLCINPFANNFTLVHRSDTQGGVCRVMSLEHLPQTATATTTTSEGDMLIMWIAIGIVASALVLLLVMIFAIMRRERAKLAAFEKAHSSREYAKS